MDWFTPSAHVEKLHTMVLHLVMYLSTKSGISFQTARVFVIILAALLLVTYLNVASDYEQQSKTKIKDNLFVSCLVFT